MLIFLQNLLFVGYCINCTTIIGYLILCYFLYIFYRIFYYFQNKEKLNNVIQNVQNQRNKTFNKVQEFVKLIPDFEKKYVQTLTYQQVKEELQNGKLTCCQVLASVMEKSIEIDHTNAICMFIEDSIQMAKEWDEKATDKNFKKPPLFGIPLSVKESVAIKGCPSTLGYVHRASKKTDKTSIIIQKLIENGVIPFCITNVPQSLLSFDCNNPIYGRTVNPHKATRTCGGSSGGEGALIGGGASFVGIGSDVGGSIRIPASFSGCVGVKPGSTRISQRDCHASLPGRPLVESAEGPMGRNVETCIDILSNLVNSNMHEDDPYVPPIKWRTDILTDTKPLKIGYYVNDGWFETCPAVKNAVFETIEQLKPRHEIVKFDPPNVEKAFGLYLGGLTVDGGTYLLDCLTQDIIIPEYLPSLISMTIPYSIRMILAYTIGTFYPKIKTILSAFTGSSAELRQIYVGIKEYRRNFIKSMKDQNIDALICPINPGIACRIGEANKLFPAISYTALYNMLDFPAGTVPVRSVTKTDIEENKNYPANDIWCKILKNSMSDPDCEGMPVGVQVVALPYGEELVCRLLREIEELVNYSK